MRQRRKMDARRTEHVGKKPVSVEKWHTSESQKRIKRWASQERTASGPGSDQQGSNWRKTVRERLSLPWNQGTALHWIFWKRTEISAFFPALQIRSRRGRSRRSLPTAGNRCRKGQKIPGAGCSISWTTRESV